jgi:glutathione synthase
MTIKLAVVMDDIATIKVKKDSTLAMLLAAQQRNWQLHYMELTDLYLADGQPMANSRLLQVEDNDRHWFDLGPARPLELSRLDVILMRKDPPVDNLYTYATYVLERAQQTGVLVINDPQSLRDCNEKIFASAFPEYCPPTLISADNSQLKAFLAEHQEVVYKPLDGMGGSSVFRLKQGDANLSVVLETLTCQGRRPIVAQRFIPQIAEGDKRILLINGEPVDYGLARIPAAGETRGNLAAGGRGKVQPLSARDRQICQQVGPVLRAKGLSFVGIDVIGDYLTEINVTSPTCIREIEQTSGLAIADLLMDFIVQQLK